MLAQTGWQSSRGRRMCLMPAVRKVVVLGAGVLGLNVAAELAERGARVVVAARPLDHRTASLRSYSWL
ncbi:FAD-dependent oxidoreductase, partial [Escherichia coli]|uniref:FAD-dependent oxidoreductase n=1 Tax=Escherichia coli TaxID=562 RepID=UPI0034D2B31F